MTIFLQRLPATIELSLFAIVVAIVLGIPLGYFAARRQGSFLDSTAVIASLVGVAVPVFFLAFLLKYWFAIELHWLPVSGRQTGGIDATRVTGFFVLDGILTQEWDAAWDAFKHLILPGLALASIPFAVIFLDHPRLGPGCRRRGLRAHRRVQGLLARTIRGRHILRNAMLPVVTTVGLQGRRAPGRGGAHRARSSSSGIGEVFAISFERRDYAVLQVLILAAAAIYVLVNLLVDIAYAVIDPRVRTR